MKDSPIIMPGMLNRGGRDLSHLGKQPTKMEILTTEVQAHLRNFDRTLGHLHMMLIAMCQTLEVDPLTLIEILQDEEGAAAYIKELASAERAVNEKKKRDAAEAAPVSGTDLDKSESLTKKGIPMENEETVQENSAEETRPAGEEAVAGGSPTADAEAAAAEHDASVDAGADSASEGETSEAGETASESEVA